MYTKARIAGHPIHPMLIAFPVAMYTSTVAALVVHLGTHDPFWYRFAWWTNISGVILAAVAAIPGLIDLLDLPARSRARTTGVRHAGFNVLALALFTCSAVVIYRNYFGQPPVEGRFVLDGTAPLVLSIIGLLATVTAGALGWTLVQTHHVGVRPTQRDRVGLRPPEEIDDLDELVVPTTTVTVVEGERLTFRS